MRSLNDIQHSTPHFAVKLSIHSTLNCLAVIRLCSLLMLLKSISFHASYLIDNVVVQNEQLPLSQLENKTNQKS